MVKVDDMDSDIETYDHHDLGEGAEMEEATELNRLLPEMTTKETVVLLNHSPPPDQGANDSPPRSSSRRNTATAPVSIPMTHMTNGSQHDQDVDKISSSPEDNSGMASAPPPGEDQTDECSRLTRDVTPPPIDQAPKSGEYKKIMELLKEAEASADPEYEERKRRLEFMTKFNPRNPDSGLGFVDYCCNLFQCCALCIEG